jgi:hypothetical protein
MQLWLTSFILLFGVAEFWQWVQQVSLPMPIFVLGGAFLAIASNYTKLSTLPFHLDYKAPNSPFNPVTSTQANQAVSPAIPQKSAVPPSPLSFEIQKPFKPGD